MNTKTMKLSVIVSAAVALGALGMPAATQGASARTATNQPAAETVLNLPQATASHDKVTLQGNAQFDGNYIRVNLSREGVLYSGALAGITLNDKGEPYLAEGTIIGVDATITQSGGIELKSPRWINDGDPNKAVIVLQTASLNEEQKASLAASAELSVAVKLNGVQEAYILKFPLKQTGVLRNIQPPAPRADSQLQINTTRVTAGAASVRIALTVTGESAQAQAVGYDIYDNLGNPLSLIARESAAAAGDAITEDLLIGSPRPDAQYLIIRPYQAAFAKGSSGAYKLDAQGKVIKDYNKQLEIKIPLK
ncbi:DUF5643 domain-containing protein [Paenibacillus borealis]|uniref:DUF5643 domain-containing protein n=1 Tax=Paenibacillus borealis TaxID=160799 RepID=A0A089LL47_PAEBO|nr:DUF5643 domain-containing protein [Paenibacillus borealis]AIQ61627.1 hypothetical protein PBOR_35540 [Paenibacillus borealis]